MEQNSFTKLVCAQAAFTVAAKRRRFSSLNASFLKSCGWITLKFWKVSLQIIVKAWNTKNIWLVITFLYTLRYSNTPYARARFVTTTNTRNTITSTCHDVSMTSFSASLLNSELFMADMIPNIAIEMHWQLFGVWWKMPHAMTRNLHQVRMCACYSIRYDQWIARFFSALETKERSSFSSISSSATDKESCLHLTGPWGLH